MLIALAGFGRNSPVYRRVIDPNMAPEWLHVLVHIMLYAGLVLLFLGAFRFPSYKKALPVVIGMVLIVGVVQEVTQSLSMGTIPLRGIMFDLGVDLTGGVLGLVIGYWYFYRGCNFCN
jgi:Na+-transporting NADH:ubiquinone oxidoreductase subunit NqrD